MPVPRCPYCHDSVAAARTRCPPWRGCGAIYHALCWRECLEHYGGCAIYGCRGAELDSPDRHSTLQATWSERALFPVVALVQFRGRGNGPLWALLIWAAIGLGLFLAGTQLVLPLTTELWGPPRPSNGLISLLVLSATAYLGANVLGSVAVEAVVCEPS